MLQTAGLFQSAVVTTILVTVGFATSVVIAAFVAPKLIFSKPAQEAARKLLALVLFLAFLAVAVLPRLAAKSAA